MKTRAPLETIEQQHVIAWADSHMFNRGRGPELIGLHLAAIPNGGSRRKIVKKGISLEAIRMKREGVRAGFPNLQLTVPMMPYHGLFVEMKRVDGVPSDVKPAQKEWHERLIKDGYAVAVAFGALEAIKIIVDYLNGKEIVYECKRARS